MIELLIQISVGIPVLYIYAGLMKISSVPIWLRADLVLERKPMYFILTYLAALPLAPIAFFGGNFIRSNNLGSSQLVFLAGVPLVFFLKYIAISTSGIEFDTSSKGAD